MSSLFGFTGSDFSLSKMASALRHWKPDREGGVETAQYAIGVQELFKTPECPLVPQPFAQNHLQIALDGRIDNRAWLVNELSIPNPQNLSDVCFIAHAYKKWGSRCFNILEGDFSIVIYDDLNKELVLGRDKMGVKPLYYATENNQLVFASEIKGILAVLPNKGEVNEKTVVSYFSALQKDPEQTLYDGVLSLQPGHWLRFKNSEVIIHQYWSLGQDAPAIPTLKKDREAHFNKLFSQSVVKRLRTYRAIGAEVSGGLDSTGIAAEAMEFLGKGHTFYSFCYGKPLHQGEHSVHDDTDLVKEFCVTYGIGDFLTITNEENMDPEAVINFSAKYIDELDTNGVPTFTNSFLPKAQNNNVGVMLSGWAGDQMVTNTCGGFSEALAIKGKYKLLWKDIQMRHNGLKLLLNFIRFVGKAMFKPFYKMNLKVAQNRLKNSALNHALIKKYTLEDIVGFRYFLKSQTNLKDYQRWNMFHNGINDRVVHHVLTGKHYRVDYRFPMLDVPLLEYIHQLPLETVAPKGETRYLFKKCIKGKVPDAVINLHKSRVSTAPFALAFYERNSVFLNGVINKEMSSAAAKEFFTANAFNFAKNQKESLKYIQVLKKINK